MLGIDVRWRQDSGNEENDVALMQIASQYAVVLIRTCKIGIPKKLIDFLRYVASPFLVDRSQNLIVSLQDSDYSYSGLLYSPPTGSL